jgi:glycogen debranching enzyme
VWVWWIGPFIEAWLRVYGASEKVKQEVRERFFNPFVQSLDLLDQKHFPEITDGEFPHQARGCPFQAWSLGEVMRVERLLK